MNVFLERNCIFFFRKVNEKNTKIIIKLSIGKINKLINKYALHSFNINYAVSKEKTPLDLKCAEVDMLYFLSFVVNLRFELIFFLNKFSISERHSYRWKLYSNYAKMFTINCTHVWTKPRKQQLLYLLEKNM